MPEPIWDVPPEALELWSDWQRRDAEQRAQAAQAVLEARQRAWNEHRDITTGYIAVTDWKEPTEAAASSGKSILIVVAVLAVVALMAGGFGADSR